MSEIDKHPHQDEPTVTDLEQTIAEIEDLRNYRPEPYQPPADADPSEHTLLRFAYNQARGFGEAAAKSSVILITHRQTSEALWHAATHDDLTGLLNRAGLAAHLESKPAPQALLYLDSTNFKAVNDTKGHSRGDRLITETADILGQAMRENDLIARDGGDEFVIILDNTYEHNDEELREDVGSARRRIEELMEGFLADPANSDLVDLGYSIAIGVAIRESGVDYNHLKDLAERDMKLHKKDQHEKLGRYRSSGSS